MVGDLVEMGAKDTPQYDPYEDDSKKAETFCILDEEQEVTQEWGGQCARGDTMARG